MFSFDCFFLLQGHNTAVKTDILLNRLHKALSRLSEQDDEERWRHGFTLLRLYESMRAMLGLPDGGIASEMVLHRGLTSHSYLLSDSFLKAMFNAAFLSRGFEPVFEKPQRFVNPNVSWRALHEKGVFVGRLLYREFDELVATEVSFIRRDGSF